MVLTVLAVKFDAWFAWITLAALACYITFTVLLTEWRTKFRREANEFDSAAHSKAVDSLLNYETVKYFNNEGFEARRYDESLQRLRRTRRRKARCRCSTRASSSSLPRAWWPCSGAPRRAWSMAA
jgi:ABC-type transport system involved in Fe-S cluster assembly fused permease/ATPase subunit